MTCDDVLAMLGRAPIVIAALVVISVASGALLAWFTAPRER